jgi:uncharacterized damage-inducible protein DinB
MTRVLGIAAVLLGAGSILAQDSHSLADATVKHWETSKAFTLAVVDKMPEDQYSFKATQAEMSFGEMANHIADADLAYCASALGSKPGPKASDASKSAVTKHLTEAFDTCIADIKKMSDADLMKTVGEGTRKATAFERFWGGFTHTAHHRGQLEVYLRLKGIQPPQYQF